MSKRRSVLYFPNSTLLSRVKGHKGSPVLPRLLPSIVMGSLLRRAHFESLRAAEAKNAATINRSRSCITGNIALGAWSQANKALGCASCFIGSRPRPRAIFPVMHSHGTLTNINVKAPKCTLFSKQYFIIQGQRSQGLTGLATAPSEHRDGQLTSESPFRIVESG